MNEATIQCEFEVMERPTPSRSHTVSKRDGRVRARGIMRNGIEGDPTFQPQLKVWLAAASATVPRSVPRIP